MTYDLYDLQRRRHHADVESRFIERSRTDRFKSIGLQLTGVMGQIARGAMPEEFADQVLMAAAGAANAMNFKLTEAGVEPVPAPGNWAYSLADPVGRFCDAAEKIDHMESFHQEAMEALRDIVAWGLAARTAA